MNTPNTATRFEVGTTYRTRFACDADTTLECTVVDRTDKSVRIRMHGKVALKRIRVHYGVESFATASYSMAPVFFADKPAK